MVSNHATVSLISATEIVLTLIFNIISYDGSASYSLI